MYQLSDVFSGLNWQFQAEPDSLMMVSLGIIFLAAAGTADPPALATAAGVPVATAAGVPVAGVPVATAAGVPVAGVPVATAAGVPVATAAGVPVAAAGLGVLVLLQATKARLAATPSASNRLACVMCCPSFAAGGSGASGPRPSEVRLGHDGVRGRGGRGGRVVCSRCAAEARQVGAVGLEQGRNEVTREIDSARPAGARAAPSRRRCGRR